MLLRRSFPGPFFPSVSLRVRFSLIFRRSPEPGVSCTAKEGPSSFFTSREPGTRRGVLLLATLCVICPSFGMRTLQVLSSSSCSSLAAVIECCGGRSRALPSLRFDRISPPFERPRHARRFVIPFLSWLLADRRVCSPFISLTPLLPPRPSKRVLPTGCPPPVT